MGPGAAREGNDDPRQASTGPPHHQGMWTQMQLTGHSQFCFVLFFSCVFSETRSSDDHFIVLIGQVVIGLMSYQTARAREGKVCLFFSFNTFLRPSSVLRIW